MERPRSSSSGGVGASGRGNASQAPTTTGAAASASASVSSSAARRPAKAPGSSSSSSSTATSSRQQKPCRSCGQLHSHHEPHLYNYEQEVDEDLMCQICLQPFVQPLDTPCSHTFCHACLNNYLKVNPMCPLDRKPVNELTVAPSNLVLKR